MKKAFAKAGFKLGGGLALVVAVIGVRMITADPDGLDDEIAELERLEEELAADAAERGVETPDGPSADGLVARVSATVREHLPSSASSGPDPNRLVKCDLGGGIQFMRAADCQTRGGDVSDVD